MQATHAVHRATVNVVAGRARLANAFSGDATIVFALVDGTGGTTHQAAADDRVAILTRFDHPVAAHVGFDVGEARATEQAQHAEQLAPTARHRNGFSKSVGICAGAPGRAFGSFLAPPTGAMAAALADGSAAAEGAAGLGTTTVGGATLGTAAAVEGAALAASAGGAALPVAGGRNTANASAPPSS